MKDTQLEVEKVDIDKIDPNSWNPNSMPEEHFDMLKREYERIGYVQPVLVRPMTDKEGRYEIVDGEHRWRALRQKGAEKLHVVIKELDDDEARKTTLNMNDIKGTDNPVELAKVLEDLTEGTAVEDLEEDLLMDKEEIEQHELLLDLPDSDELTEELDEATSEDEDDGLDEVVIEFSVQSDTAEGLEEEFSCSRSDLDSEIKKFVEDQIL